MRAGEARRTLTLRLFIWSLIVTGCVYQTVVIPSSSSGVQQKLTLLEKELCPACIVQLYFCIPYSYPGQTLKISLGME